MAEVVSSPPNAFADHRSAVPAVANGSATPVSSAKTAVDTPACTAAPTTTVHIRISVPDINYTVRSSVCTATLCLFLILEFKLF